MRSLPSKFLAVALAVALLVAFHRRARVGPAPEPPESAVAAAPGVVLLRLAAK
jgi:hypothetical protein